MGMKRQIIVDGEIARVPLTLGRFAIIDAEDVPRVEGHDWSSLFVRGKWYARRNKWTKDKQITVLLHRVILNAPDDMHVDHRDGDGLNCRKLNLRLATQQQNNLNTSKKRNSSSSFKGVRKHSMANRYVADICANGVRKYLGCFKTAEEAYAAYCAASAELHGEFGRVK
jgi:hypothetical protein